MINSKKLNETLESVWPVVIYTELIGNLGVDLKFKEVK